MATITLREAQATLPELIHRLAPGEALEITENCQPGTHAGSVLYMSPDFDAPLEYMKEYME